MIKRLLIANRGEIACRIIRTARELGIETVAIYSSIDVGAQHVRLADSAYCIGEAAASESYLKADDILALAQRIGVDAIHPGYGFLSENAQFSRDCQRAGITFVGPSGDAIEAMGSKSKAKAMMQAAGVPVVPGYHGDDQSYEILAAAAQKIGYPVLLKAAAGGGGKGMRRVDHASEFGEALASAKREAMASFGDDLMLIEKCLLTPRHIEVQLMCDTHGNAIYIGDRDCSVQRRHQKIIEEAPAPGLTEEVRKAMGEAAVAAALAIDYCGAGTIEFLYQDGEFYFMEMNTRLQVEHPVSEAISGLDLVAMQLAVADGKALQIVQQDVVTNGHAIELRVYAEDVERDFLPAAGCVAVYVEPDSTNGLRIDSGVVEGDVISPFYDPMIAKVIAHGANRQAALASCRSAIRSFQLEGIQHNLDFLYRVLGHPQFERGEVSTAFLADNLSEVMEWGEALPVGVVMALYQHLQSTPQSPWYGQRNFRINLPSVAKYWTQQDCWSVQPLSDCFVVSSGEQRYEVSAQNDGSRLSVSHHGEQYRFDFIPTQAGVRVFGRHSAIYVAWRLPQWEAHDAADDAALLAPMNGRIIACCVDPGQAVEKGTTLLIMEAMKMEYAIKAPSAGVIEGFLAGVNDLVEGGQLLVNFTAEESLS